MSDITMDEISVVVSGSSDKANDSFERLISVLDRLSDIVETAFDGLKKSGKKLDDFSNKSDKNMRKVQKIFSSAQKNILKFAAGMGIMTFSFNKSITEISDYISAQVSFNRILGTSEENLKQVTKFVNDLTNSWYLDGQEVMKATSRYFTMTKTMGMTEEASFRMSKNLTMLSYDLQLLGTTGARITEVQNQIASALRGEAEGLAKYGISLNQATLQSVLYEKGINRTVSSLTAAQKAELIYYQIMRQTAQYHGYYAEQLEGFENGLLQPAMAMQILRTQALNFARALGSVFIPILSAALPYLIALTQLLTNLAKKIADFLGFKLEDWDMNTDGITGGFADIGDSADKASKKVKGALGDFDELHTISFPEASGAAGIGAGGSLGLDASEFEYSEKLLGVTNEKIEKAKQFLNEIKDYLVTIGLIISGYKISSAVIDFLKNFGVLSKKTKTLKMALGVGLTLGGIYLSYKGIEKVLDGDITGTDILELISGNATFAGGILTLSGGNIKLALAATLAIDGFFASYEGAQKILSGDFGWGDVLSVAGGSIGVGLATLLYTGSFTLGGLGIILSLTASFALASLPSWDEIKQSFEIILNEIKKWWESANTTQKILQIGKYIVLGILTGIAIAVLGIPGLIASMFVIFIHAISDAFGIASPAKKMIPYGEYIILGIFEGIMALFGKVVDIFVKLKDKIIIKLIEIKDGAISKITEMKENITKKFEEIKTNVTEKFENIKTTIEDKITTAKDKVKEAIDKIKGFFKFEWSLPDIKTPHIRWESEPATGWIANTLDALGLPTSIPKMKVDWYAEGGFPNAGDLFIANEAGAEWVGSMNGRTAVANNDQISKGVEEASYRGMARALQEYGYAGVTVINKLDSKEIASKTTKVIRSNANMYG